MLKNLYIIPVVILYLSGCTSSVVKHGDSPANQTDSKDPIVIEQEAQHNVEIQPQIDPKARKLLEKMSAILASSKQFSFDALTLKDQVLPSGQKLQYDAKVHIDINRPNAFKGKVNSGAKNKALFYDGQALTLLDLKNNFYATTDAPNNIDDTLDFIMDKYGISMPLADFLFADINQVLTEHVESGIYVALTAVNGKPAHHLAFTQDNIDWQIWINAKGKPTPIKFVINYKNQFSEPQFIAFFQQWDLSPGFKTEDFIFQPSKNRVEIEFFETDER